MKEPPDRALSSTSWRVSRTVEDLVRKDSQFKKLELDADDYVGNPEAVIDLLAERKAFSSARSWSRATRRSSVARRTASPTS